MVCESSKRKREVMSHEKRAQRVGTPGLLCQTIISPKGSIEFDVNELHLRAESQGNEAREMSKAA